MIRVSDYISRYLVEHGINHVFTVVGGGAMYLNDSFGHQEGLTCIYNHHEQSCAMAAEAYARLDNHIAAVCVTSGPGGTNAITGVLGGWLDSIPMLIISGQVRYPLTVRSTDLGIRSMGDQEYDICRSVDAMTKYCEMVTEPLRIGYCLEKALHLARTGRPGPCWIDVPLDMQSALIDENELIHYDPAEDAELLPPPPDDKTIDEILGRVAKAKRPILYAGNGIRLSGAYTTFRKVVDALGIPVVTCWNSADLIPDEHPFYAGRAGIAGTRPGNFAVQNSDLILAIGTRLGIRQVGFDAPSWAPGAFVIMCDICTDEMRKPTIHVEMPVWADARTLLEKINQALGNHPLDSEDSYHQQWIGICREWIRTYPVTLPRHYEQEKPANVYALIAELSRRLEPGQVTIVGSGSACVAGGQAFIMKEGSRFLLSSAVCALGYDLPGAIGACIAEHGNGALWKSGVAEHDTILLTGDGSIQFNLQELQVIIHHMMPIKIFIINNQGYHSIRLTQRNAFSDGLVGIGPDSGDLSFPDMGKIASAYGFPFRRCACTSDLGNAIEDTLAIDGPAICEIMVSTDQPFEPKAASRCLEDGTFVSPPLEDLAPFLSREELARIMAVSKGRD